MATKTFQPSQQIIAGNSEEITDKIDEHFEQLKNIVSNGVSDTEKTLELKTKLKRNADNFFSLPEREKEQFYKSTGYSGGNNRLGRARISRAKDEKEAERAVKIYNESLNEFMPEVTVFHINAGRYILSEDFGSPHYLNKKEGTTVKRITDAGLELYKKHLENVIDITQSPKVKHPFDIIGQDPYEKEDYLVKTIENMERLREAYPDLKSETLRESKKLALEMLKLPMQPAWDLGWKKNAKFKGDVIKYFDLTKTTRLLRVKAYDTAQAVLGYGKNTEELKKHARKRHEEYGMDQAEFDYLWDRNAHYYFTRRMRYTDKEAVLNNLVKLYLQEPFPTLEPARKLQEELARFQ